MSATSFAPVVALAIGLALDAAAAAVACGVAAPEVRARHYVLVAACFGAFHAAMPLAGWLLGRSIGPAIEAWDHWLAFVVLGGLGAKMIYDARKAAGADAAAAGGADMLAAKVVLGLAVATSVDACAAGITLPMFDVPIALSIATIGLAGAAAPSLGLAVGRRLGVRLGRGLDVIGGLALIGVGTKILVEHLLA